MYIRALVVSGTNLLAGGDSTGVLRRPLSEMITAVKDNENDVPKQFSLSQNYPNPFNPTTTIQFVLPHRSRVTLEVFNTLGQQVAELVNADIDAGNHEVQFTAANLASGLCFCRLQAGEFVQTRSLVLETRGR